MLLKQDQSVKSLNKPTPYTTGHPCVVSVVVSLAGHTDSREPGRTDS